MGEFLKRPSRVWLLALVSSSMASTKTTATLSLNV